MKNISTITFHRAHNFGSVLQTYALQEFIHKIASEHNEQINYSVIDYYPQLQEDLYKVFKPWSSPKNIIKNAITLPFAPQLIEKHNKFNEFVSEYFNLTNRYYTDNELENNPPKADYYISGSDQIWNVRAKDFSLSYYLSFVKQGKKISYAASLGPKMIDWSKYNSQLYKKALSEFNNISVREIGSVNNINAMLDINCEIHVDPTLLLSAVEWRKIQSDANYNNGQYILMYCLEPTKEQLKIADAFSKKLKLPIMILRYNNKNDMFNHYVKRYNSGPRDFLSYIDNAAVILTSSFHGTAFSLIYKKPFYVLNGMTDNRISSILKSTKMENRSLESIKDVNSVTLDQPDIVAIDAFLSQEKERSEKYLKEVLDFE